MSEWLPRPLRFYAPGTPAPQGSKVAKPLWTKRGADRQFTGRIAMFESNAKKVKGWRDAVGEAAEKAIATWAARTGSEWSPIAEGVSLHLGFYLARPKATKYPDGPFGKPDLDKLVRATMDALSIAGVWTDDARVCELRTSKRWAPGGQEPGAHIMVWRGYDDD